MKALRPGQLCTIRKVVYRAKKRTMGCQGCSLDNPFICPNIQAANFKGETYSIIKLDCLEHGIILIKLN